MIRNEGTVTQCGPVCSMKDCHLPARSKRRLWPHLPRVDVCRQHLAEYGCGYAGCDWMAVACPHGHAQVLAQRAEQEAQEAPQVVEAPPPAPRPTQKASPCLVEACGRDAAVRGLCRACYQRHLAAGTLDDVAAPPQNRGGRPRSSTTREDTMPAPKLPLTASRALHLYKEHGTVERAADVAGVSTTTLRRRLHETDEGKEYLAKAKAERNKHLRTGGNTPSMDYDSWPAESVLEDYARLGSQRLLAKEYELTAHQVRALIDSAKRRAPEYTPPEQTKLVARSLYEESIARREELVNAVRAAQAEAEREHAAALDLQAKLAEARRDVTVLRDAWAGVCAALDMPPTPPAAVVERVRALVSAGRARTAAGLTARAIPIRRDQVAVDPHDLDCLMPYLADSFASLLCDPDKRAIGAFYRLAGAASTVHDSPTERQEQAS